ncbi:MAG: bifunctional diguanylate cyclase/phosphodiesterase [Hyphomicrobiales bacterium]
MFSQLNGIHRNIFVGLFVILAIGVVDYGISRTVDIAVSSDASRKATDWAEYMKNKVPDLKKLIATGKPTDVQIREIQESSNAGDVFRFKLFNADANLVLVSDELEATGGEFVLGDHNGKAAKVLETGEIQLEFGDGTQKANRPDLYVETYVPIIGVNAEVLGVAEVYLDQTPISALFHRWFSLLALGIGGVLLVMFILPYVAFLQKSNANNRSREKANYLAHYDQLANLFNRRGLMETFEERWANGSIDMKNMAVVFLDIDQFKIINDTYGHTAGDTFLTHVGECISSAIDSEDLAGRMGGDEFMIILERDSVDDVQAVMEKIRTMVATPVQHDGNTIVGHVSVGIHYEDAELTIGQRMQKADVALYQSKIDGRNVCRTFTAGMEARTLRRRHVEAAILTGLAEERFEVYFQPLLHQKTKECAGFEALLRLWDKNGDAISPAEFIPIAESIGAINELGLWVLETALKSVVNWPDNYFVSVNLSARQFDDQTLVSNVRRLLDETGVRPEYLELEVTESLLMENTESISVQLEELRETGVSLAMDDFGTGYSSLGYLWKFGFDKLKIDQSFISGLEVNTDKTKDILDTIIVLGHKLGMTVTAEGIETDLQEKILSSMDCDHIQGYKYGKPMPSADLPNYFLKMVSTNLETADIVPMKRAGSAG